MKSFFKGVKKKVVAGKEYVETKQRQYEEYEDRRTQKQKERLQRQSAQLKKKQEVAKLRKKVDKQRASLRPKQADNPFGGGMFGDEPRRKKKGRDSFSDMW